MANQIGNMRPRRSRVAPSELSNLRETVPQSAPRTSSTYRFNPVKPWANATRRTVVAQPYTRVRGTEKFREPPIAKAQARATIAVPKTEAQSESKSAIPIAQAYTDKSAASALGEIDNIQAIGTGSENDSLNATFELLEMGMLPLNEISSEDLGSVTKSLFQEYKPHNDSLHNMSDTGVGTLVRGLLNKREELQTKKKLSIWFSCSRWSSHWNFNTQWTCRNSRITRSRYNIRANGTMEAL